MTPRSILVNPNSSACGYWWSVGAYSIRWQQLYLWWHWRQLEFWTTNVNISKNRGISREHTNYNDDMNRENMQRAGNGSRRDLLNATRSRYNWPLTISAFNRLNQNLKKTRRIIALRDDGTCVTPWGECQASPNATKKVSGAESCSACLLLLHILAA